MNTTTECAGGLGGAVATISDGLDDSYTRSTLAHEVCHSILCVLNIKVDSALGEFEENVCEAIGSQCGDESMK